MKTMKNVLTAILLVFGIQILAAKDIKVSVSGNESVIIEVINEKQNEKIKIMDNEGNILFFENISTKNYLKTFAMSSLPSGKYYIEYEDDDKVKIATVKKTKEGLLITSNFSKITFKPMFSQKGNYLSIGITNLKNEKVGISISDEYGFELIDIKGLNEFLVSKTFNTRKLPEGKYKVNVTCGDKSYTKFIDIQ